MRTGRWHVLTSAGLAMRACIIVGSVGYALLFHRREWGVDTWTWVAALSGGAALVSWYSARRHTSHDGRWESPGGYAKWLMGHLFLLAQLSYLVAITGGLGSPLILLYAALFCLIGVERPLVRGLVMFGLLGHLSFAGLLYAHSRSLDFYADAVFWAWSLSMGMVFLSSVVVTGSVQRSLELSLLDPMTGLPNRRYLEQVLSGEIERARRLGQPLSVLMVDLDDFKLFNDRMGHQAGDRLLRELAEVMRRTVRGMDLVARYGGDEFMVVLPATDLAGAVEAGRRLRLAVRNRIWEGNGVLPGGRITISVGACSFPDGAASLEELVQNADHTLMQCAKRRGKDTVEAFSPDLALNPKASNPAERRQLFP